MPRKPLAARGASNMWRVASAAGRIRGAATLSMRDISQEPQRRKRPAPPQPKGRIRLATQAPHAGVRRPWPPRRGHGCARPGYLRHGLLALVLGAIAHASSPTAWETNTYQDFSKARLDGVSIHRNGTVTLAPKLDPVFDSGQPVVWSAAAGPDGSVYLGTGHKGRVYRVDAAGKGELLWTAPEAEVFAIAVDASGAVFAATSPNGKIYRIQGKQGAEYFNPGAKFIWALAAAKDGSLYAATGDDGKVFRVTAPGRGEVYYETGQGHVTSLAIDARGRLLAGSDPNGILYRIEARDKAFVLHDASFPEIRAIVPTADGGAYIAAMGGAAAKQSGAAVTAAPAATGTGQTPVVTTTITVTDDGTAAQGGADIKPKPPQQGQPQQNQPQQGQQQQQQTAVTSSVIEIPGLDKSAILRIHPDNPVETLWTSKDENAYDIAASGAGLLVATDNQGRVYRLENRKLALLAETREGEVLRVIPHRGGALLATGEQGKLLRLGDAAAPEGSIESPVHDASAVARWGKLGWRAETCDGCSIAFSVRAGNSARPDKTWSDWSAPLTDSAGAAIPVPNARYVQWKAALRGTAGASPALDSVRLTYHPQNSPPLVKSVTVTAQISAVAPLKQAQQQPAAAYSITVTDTGESGATSATGTATQPITRAAVEGVLVSWAAEDTDGDKLFYSLHVRAEGETEWRPVKLDFAETSHVVEAESLADGRYWFRVTATDRAANPPADAREVELVSAPVLADRTPPVVAASAPARSGAAVEVRVEASDASSPLRAAEYMLDHGPWIPLAALDGVVDSAKESFVVRIDPAPAAGRALVVRVYDSANNAGVIRTIIR